MAKKAVVFLITLYQATFSPDHGRLARVLFPRGVCRYQPTCSEYTKQAVTQFGVIKGLQLGLKRMSRCHPGYPGGLDPVPPVE